MEVSAQVSTINEVEVSGGSDVQHCVCVYGLAGCLPVACHAGSLQYDHQLVHGLQAGFWTHPRRVPCHK